MTSIYSSLFEETAEIVTRHLEALGQYIPTAQSLAENVPHQVVNCLERLMEISYCPPQVASAELYQEACDCYEHVQAFLRTMDQPLDTDFEESGIGQILAHVSAWKAQAARQHPIPITTVWELLDPAKPDHLDDLGEGCYEAKWWKPVPIMDIEMLKYTEGITLCGKPFEPATLPGGLAVRFKLSAEMSSEI